MKDVIVVGMPRSGSEAFHKLMVQIGKNSGTFRVVNPAGEGRQHIPAKLVNGKTPVLVIWRNPLDALVSAYFYIRDYEDGIKRHFLQSRIEGKSKAESLDVLAKDYFRDRIYNWIQEYQKHERAMPFRYEKVFFEGGGIYIQDRLKAAGLVVSMEIIEDALTDVSFSMLHKKDPVHYRTGKPGIFRDHLTQNQIDQIGLSI
tara:strand:+ start:1501 stop:2103 length:603 start_codon:yes stop_codon:yes gene_type:complete